MRRRKRIEKKKTKAKRTVYYHTKQLVGSSCSGARRKHEHTRIYKAGTPRFLGQRNSIRLGEKCVEEIFYERGANSKAQLLMASHENVVDDDDGFCSE